MQNKAFQQQKDRTIGRNSLMHCDNLTILVDTWKMAINMN